VGGLMANITYSPKSFLTGSLCILKLNDKIIGFSKGINYQIRIEYRKNKTIDYIYPVEVYPYSTNVGGQIRNFIITDLNPTRMKVQPIIDNILLNKYIDIQVYRKDDEGKLVPFISFPKSAIIDRSESFSAGETSYSTLTFISTSWKDISESNEQQAYQYDQEKLKEAHNYLKSFENQTYVPDFIRDTVTGSLSGLGLDMDLNKNNNKIGMTGPLMNNINKGVDYATKDVEVVSYLSMNWDEDEEVINQVKNNKK
jgi:hypothetical protein